MPTKGGYPCRFPGCPAVLRKSGYCEKHEKKVKRDLDKNRPSSSQRGYGARWQRYRKWFLARHPFCADCEERGEMTEATVVDHVIPHRGDRKLFWDKTNHRALCATCHNRKTMREIIRGE